MADVPYCDKLDIEWAHKVSEYGWKRHPHTYELHGECPRCQHPMHLQIDIIRPAVAVDEKPEVPGRCTCEEEHKPEKKGAGCGFYGPITFKGNITDAKDQSPSQ